MNTEVPKALVQQKGLRPPTFRSGLCRGRASSAPVLSNTDRANREPSRTHLEDLEGQSELVSRDGSYGPIALFRNKGRSICCKYPLGICSFPSQHRAGYGDPLTVGVSRVDLS